MRTRSVKSMSKSSARNPQSYLGGPLSRPPIHDFQKDPCKSVSMPPPYGWKKPAALKNSRPSERAGDDSDVYEGEEVVVDDNHQDFFDLRQTVNTERAHLETQHPCQTEKNQAGNKTSTANAESNESRGATFDLLTLLCIVSLGVLLSSVVIYYMYIIQTQSDCIETLPDEQWLRENLTKNMKIIRDEFPSQVKNIWHSFYVGIRKVLLERPTEPSIFLLIHEGTEGTTSCLARKVGQVAHDFLNASEPDPLFVDGGSLGRDETLAADRGRLIEDYRPLVESHRIVILDNLHLMPATLAQGLHIFCDTVTPLVRKAVYIFTLNISVGNDEGNPTRIAEKELSSVWRQLDEDILSALIARITGGSVFRIHPEQSMINTC